MTLISLELPVRYADLDLKATHGREPLLNDGFGAVWEHAPMTVGILSMDHLAPPKGITSPMLAEAKSSRPRKLAQVVREPTRLCTFDRRTEEHGHSHREPGELGSREQALEIAIEADQMLALLNDGSGKPGVGQIVGCQHFVGAQLA